MYLCFFSFLNQRLCWTSFLLIDSWYTKSPGIKIVGIASRVSMLVFLFWFGNLISFKVVWFKMVFTNQLNYNCKQNFPTSTCYSASGQSKVNKVFASLLIFLDLESQKNFLHTSFWCFVQLIAWHEGMVNFYNAVTCLLTYYLSITC